MEFTETCLLPENPKLQLRHRIYHDENLKDRFLVMVLLDPYCTAGSEHSTFEGAFAEYIRTRDGVSEGSDQ